jgi:hypothetical protein
MAAAARTACTGGARRYAGPEWAAPRSDESGVHTTAAGGSGVNAAPTRSCAKWRRDVCFQGRITDLS